MAPTHDTRFAIAPNGEYAALDLGSNSFHLVLAQRLGDQVRIVDRLRETVRLGGGLADQGVITEDAWRRALDVLARFGQRLRALPPGHVRAVGTYSLRRARNGRAFLSAAADALGHPVEVVSGQEEARLIYRGVTATQGPAEGRRLVVDIGGGSSELISGRGLQPELMESLYLGCVIYSQRFFPNQRVTPKRWKAAVTAALLELQPVAGHFRAIGWDEAIGTSGSIRCVRDILAQCGEETITLAGLGGLRDQLLACGDTKKLGYRNISSDRAVVFAGGLAILTAMFESLGIERMGYCAGALRDGLLAELTQATERTDVRRRTVEHMMHFYHVDSVHAERVAATARALFDQAAQDWQLWDEEWQNLLVWAAKLHEIGLAISHSGYHKHGRYLLSNSDLAGFSRETQTLLALLVGAHRRSIPTDDLDELIPEHRRVALPLIALLRLAVLLHRGRDNAGPPQIRLQCRSDGITVGLPAGWLADHPLTLADLHNEKKRLRRAGMRLEITED